MCERCFSYALFLPNEMCFSRYLFMIYRKLDSIKKGCTARMHPHSLKYYAVWVTVPIPGRWRRERQLTHHPIQRGEAWPCPYS